MTHANESKGLSRREFIRLAVASGMSVSAASLTWSERVHAATPRRGGHFRVGHGNANSTDVLDPAKMVSEFQNYLNFCCRNQLVEIDSYNKLVPELAESWEASTDAKQWRFKIRSGVQFHSGKTLDVGDVVGTFRYHISEEAASNVASQLAGIESIESDGDVAVFTLKSANADFPYVFSSWQLTILPVKDGVVDADSGDGTGPYVIESHEPGIRTELTRNPNYWKEGRAHFDRVTVRGINDVTARQNALISGEVDAIDSVDPKTLSLLERRPGIVIEDVPSAAAITMPMHVDVAPFDNVDVRTALKLAIDREHVLSTIFKGRGTVGNDHPIAPVMPFWSDIPQRPYDPERARHHLKKAGAEGLSVQLSAADAAFSGAVDMAVLYSEQAKAAGLNVEVVREPNDGYWSNVWLVKPFCMCWWSGRPTQDAIYSLAYAAGSSFNDTRYANPRFNELMVMARGELDPTRRAAMYGEMQQIYHDDGGTIIPMFRNFVFARSDKIATPDSMTGVTTLDGARSAERWWFA